MPALPVDDPSPTPTGDADPAVPVEPPLPHPPLDRRHVARLVVPLIPMFIAVQVGNAFFPVLQEQAPLLLMALGAANRNLLVAVAQGVPWFLYALVGGARLLLPDPFFYAIGWHYGDRSISWMERRTPTFGQLLRELERLFAKAGWAFVLVLPNNYVCLLAGAAQMRRSWFWTLNIVGTIGRLIVLWWIGQALQDVIDTVLSFITDHRVPFLVVTVGLVLLTTGREWRSGGTEVQALIELEHELEEVAPDAPHHPHDGAADGGEGHA
jgi:membrane protein DedA with SNARE-associated domain